MAVITNDTINAGPAPGRERSPAAAVPMVAKMPAPMMAPMPSKVSCNGPNTRRSWGSGGATSCGIASSDLRWNKRPSITTLMPLWSLCGGVSMWMLTGAARELYLSWREISLGAVRKAASIPFTLAYAPCNRLLGRLMSSVRLLLVRHGETEWNQENRWQGQADVPLSETGRA